MLQKIRAKYRAIQVAFEAEVLIYSMGKVGCNTLSYSLEQSGVDCCSVHYFAGDQAHFFQPKQSNYLGKGARILVSLNARKRKRPLRVISLVRDPMARNLSLAFFSLEHLLYQSLRGKEGQKRKGQNLALNDIIQIGFEECIQHQAPLNWFDEELKTVLGINVYDHPFDQNAGYTLIKQGAIHLLILKLEKLSELDSVVQSFMQLDQFEWKSANKGTRNWYADIYQNFKQTFVPNEAYLEQLYTSKMMQHFYTAKEIETFRNHWLRVGK